MQGPRTGSTLSPIVVPLEPLAAPVSSQRCEAVHAASGRRRRRHGGMQWSHLDANCAAAASRSDDDLGCTGHGFTRDAAST